MAAPAIAKIASVERRAKEVELTLAKNEQGFWQGELEGDSDWLFSLDRNSPVSPNVAGKWICQVALYKDTGSCFCVTRIRGKNIGLFTLSRPVVVQQLTPQAKITLVPANPIIPTKDVQAAQEHGRALAALLVKEVPTPKKERKAPEQKMVVAKPTKKAKLAKKKTHRANGPTVHDELAELLGK